MAKLESLRRQEVVLSLKRYLGMAIQATFRLEEEANNQNRAFDLEREKHLDTARTLKVSETDLSKAREELKEMTRARDATETSLANAQKRAKDETRHLRDVEYQLKTSKKHIVELKKKMAEVDGAKNVAERAREEALRAKEEAELTRTEAETSKEKAEEAAYNLGVAETQTLLKSQVPKAAPPSSEVKVVPEEVGTTPDEVALTIATSDAPAKGVETAGVTGTNKDSSEEVPQGATGSSTSSQATNAEETSLLVDSQ
ncbi:uncharacterized protein LOC112035381 [Quercus suber]|uniref:uncharacterized protein LOC112035381 n=1 Tax=Quercus suber TaxID=58331 RepID=UPI000CE1C821|nr:calponin homology domain-containing protein DDB_G0272472-like [Quercus suber]